MPQKAFPKILIIAIVLAVIVGGIWVWRSWRAGIEIPGDLEIYCTWGACHAEKGRNTLQINSKGESFFILEYGLGEGFTKVQDNFILTEKELSRIYREIVKNNFFELEEKYYNPEVHDGSCDGLRIRANGKEHTVAVSNTNVNSFDKITKTIREICNSKITEKDIL